MLVQGGSTGNNLALSPGNRYQEAAFQHDGFTTPAGTTYDRPGRRAEAATTAARGGKELDDAVKIDGLRNTYAAMGEQIAKQIVGQRAVV